MAQKILITGGSGFIGSHLTERYLNDGHEVYIIDTMATGKRDNIIHLENSAQFKDRLFVRIGSILDRETMLELVGICDVVIHLAAAVGVRYIIDNPLASIDTNIRGTEVILELCNKFKKKVFIASTSEVYGKHDHAPLLETDDCVYGSSDKFRWSYAASKFMDEFAALAYYKTSKLPVVIARLFNTVGPRQTGQYGMVIPRFVQQALRNEPITVYGDGKQTRTFTHVKEVIDCIVKLMETPKAIGKVFNIGGQEEISIFSLAHRIKNMTGSSSEIRLIPYSEVFPKDFEDMQRRVPSTEKLKEIIGQSPKSDLDTILSDVIEYFRDKLLIENKNDR